MTLALNINSHCFVAASAFVFLAVHLECGHSLSRSNFERTQSFTFGAVDNSQARSTPAQLQQSNGTSPTLNQTILTRQLIIGTLPPPPPPFIPIPNIVNPGTSYCECVPPGSCANPLPTVSSDGAGQIDIRIVNNGGVINPPPAVIPAPITCNYGLVACCQAGTYQCGRRYPPPPGAALAGVGQASLGEYPWQAAILTTADVYIGGGALITAQHVLTAAHKVFNLPLTSFKVRLGEWDATSTLEPIPAQDLLVANVIINPGFNPNNLQNDIAVLRLASAVSLFDKPTVRTVCLPTTTFVGQRCWVAGWGRNDFGPTGAFQAIQREVDVPLLPNANCQAALRSTRLGANFVLSNTSFICAGGEPGKDACTGDGGSPLVCQNNNVWYVVGLVAWGIGCAQVGVPGVYVNVATYLPWVQSALV